jgi:hypothetical protein
MIGTTHRRYGACHGAGVSAALGAPPLAVLGCAVGGWYLATIPDRIEQPLGLSHRRQSHDYRFFLIPSLLAWFFPAIIAYPVHAVALAMLSHIEGDFVFGKAHTKDKPSGGYVVMRPHGVPIWPIGYRGLGRKVDGKLEKVVARRLLWAMPFIIGLSLVYSIAGSMK